MKLFRQPILSAFWAILMLIGMSALVMGQQPRVDVVSVNGMINPITARHIIRSLELANTERSELFIIVLDTPGGLLDSTQDIVESLLSSNVPTVVFVSPPGAHAASAGTFITAAANVAVMAPGTRIGAASPVAGSGEDIPDTLGNKVTQDSAALMRSIASERNRNKDRLEETVLKATSYTAEEAFSSNMVDFIARDVGEILDHLNGVVIETPSGFKTLHTQGVSIRKIDMGIVEQLLSLISDPNIAFLLLSLGTLGITVELWNPGMVFPGVAGVLSLGLAFASLGNLPVNFVGVGLILFASVLVIVEFNMAGFGLFGIGGIISFFVGGMLLFAHFDPTYSGGINVEVSMWLLSSVTLILSLVLAWIIITIGQSRSGKTMNMNDRMVGMEGVVSTRLNPRGTVQLKDGLWSAVEENRRPINTGQIVEVVAVKGLVLTVKRIMQ